MIIVIIKLILAPEVKILIILIIKKKVKNIKRSNK